SRTTRISYTGVPRSARAQHCADPLDDREAVVQGRSSEDGDDAERDEDLDERRAARGCCGDPPRDTPLEVLPLAVDLDMDGELANTRRGRRGHRDRGEGEQRRAGGAGVEVLGGLLAGDARIEQGG